jgi:hypothetical protein
MRWTRRLLVALPLAIACGLNVLMVVANRFHLDREHIAGFGFLFATPWAWLLDGVWFGNIHNRFLEAFVGYAFFLWIPGVLYSGCLWLLVVGIGRLTARHPH